MLPDPPYSSLKVSKRVAETGDQFLRRFITYWLVFAFLLWLFQRTSMPAVQFSSEIMIAISLPAWIALKVGRTTLARYLFVIPFCLAAGLIPLGANGVRTPVLANIPMLILLTGWLLGRRIMLAVAFAFALAVFAYWLAEARGWFVLADPLRPPEVWTMAWTVGTTLTTFAVWSLIGNYETNFKNEFALQEKLSAALAEAEVANQHLSSVLKFSETVLQNSPIPMAVYSADGDCAKANGAYADFVGLPLESVRTRKFDQLDVWRDSELHRHFREALENGLPQRYEMQLVAPAGTETFVECRILPTLHDNRQHLLLQFVDLSERKRVEHELRDLAFYDSLTGLPNRRLLHERLQRALLERNRSDGEVAVLFIDLNNFKELNDRHGHDAGDLLLAEVARRLTHLVRKTDTVARLGGDEFIVLLNHLDVDVEQRGRYVDVVAEKVSRLLAEEYVLGAIRHRASASVGVKLVGRDEHDVDQILKDADAAMYEVKKRGNR